MRKDIKKSSYYVWFLGAQEAKGLRGPEYVLPVVRSLVEREREVEPFKVTLQVSHKGLKIVQNVPGPGAAAAVPAPVKGAPKVLAKAPKAETVKHLIPHHAVTCVLQQDDIVACILLLYNPVTKCPVHVHAYRCDSVETAQILSGQLQTLIERPENQKKLAEIEARLRAKGLLLPAGLPPGPGSRRHGPGGHGPGSDGRSTSTRESDSSGGSSSERLSGLMLGREERVTSLYDSLAAELKEKLGADQDASHAPILLPPRDYDTVHRQKGNLASVDRRRCLNASIVGVNAKNVKNALAEEGAGAASGNKRVPGHPTAHTSRPGAGLVGSSGGSSGIGSDHAPSPDNESDPRYLDNASSSDEEWNEEPSEDSLFLVQPGLGSSRALLSELSLPRARRVHSPPSPTSPSTAASAREREHPLASPLSAGPRRRHASPSPPLERHPSRDDVEQVPSSRTRVRRPPADERQRAPRSPRSPPRSPRSSPRSVSPAGHHRHKGAPSPSLSGPMSPRERFQDAKEKFLSLERERLEEQERVMQLNLEKRRASHQQQQQQATQQSPHSPPIMEAPISPAMVSGPCPRPRPRPRRPSWSRSKDDSDDEILDGRMADRDIPAPSRGRYFPDPEDDADVDFSGNAPPTGGRQRIIAAVNRRMSRESLEDDVDDFVPAPRPGAPRRDYPAPYRGVDREREHHPVRGAEHRVDYRAEHRVDPRAEHRAEHRNNHRAEHRADPRAEHRAEHRTDPRTEHRADPRAEHLAEHRGVAPAAVSRSRSVHREQDRFRSPARGAGGYPYDPMMDESQHARYRIPYNDDLDIPLERYRSSNPLPHARAPPRHPSAAYPRGADLDEDDPRAAYLADKKRRSVFEVLEDERRRHSNELAQEFKRRSYQELDERERYPGLDRDTAREPVPAPAGPPGPPGPPGAQVSSRYRHSYAEPPPRHHDLLHRANSAASPRVGIAAVHPY